MTSCFVIGPIGDRFADQDSPDRVAYEDALQVLEQVIEPACRANEIEPVRADQISASGDINEQVFRRLRDDDIVIADVSGGNANVMYELGIRHTVNKVTIALGEYGQLPFDIRTIRSIQFSRSRRGLIDARNELTQAISTGLAEGPEEIPLTRIWAAKDSASPVTETQNQDGQDLTDPGSDELGSLVDDVSIAEQAFPEFDQVLNQMSETIEEMNVLIQDATDATQQADLRSGTASARLVVISRLAKNLDGPTSRLEQLTATYDDLLKKIDRAMRSIYVHLDTYPEELESHAIIELLNSIRTMASSSREAMESVNSYGNSAEGMGALSKRLRQPGRRISNAVKRLSTATSRIDEWDRKAAAHLTEIDNQWEKDSENRPHS